MMVGKDATQLYDLDCSTCAHRVERHPSKREEPSKPRKHNYVCYVCARAISEHGCWMSHSKQNYSENSEWLGFTSEWVQEVSCRRYDKKIDKWVPIDYDPRDSV